MSDQEEEILISKILRDIGVSSEEIHAKSKERIPVFEQIIKMPRQGFRRIGLDAATVAGSFGDWESSLLLTEKLIKEGDASYSTKIWQIHSLIELEHFSEALALATAAEWPKVLQAHAKFLTGKCFLQLNMRKQAADCFLEVKKISPNYPGIPDIFDHEN